MRSLLTPRYPEDFKLLCADGGFYYQHWHPDAPADYQGTWPMGEDPPAWSGGLWVYEEDGMTKVVWEFGPELESGPYYEVIGSSPESVQEAVNFVMMEVNRQGVYATPDV